MSKLTRRLLCIGLIVVLTVAVSIFASASYVQTTEDTQEPVCYEHGDVNGDGYVDNQDAIYTLYAYLFGQEEYPIAQVWDFDKDGYYDNLDAIHLLYGYLFPWDSDYALEGTIHSYYDPSWTWDEDAGTAQVTFKCGCGTPTTYTVGTGVTVAAGERVPATCVASGSQTYVASVTVDGSIYSSTYVKTLPAGNGHSMSGQPDCENGASCSLCDYSVPALGHNWVLESTQGATCTDDAVQIYRCSTCQATDEVEQEGTAGHVLNYLEDRRDGCKYVKWYGCANCDYTQAGTAASDTYYNHTYTATLTKEATCVSAGVKTYVCTCGDSYDEDIPKNSSHNWVEGATEKGVTTHSCVNAGCSATKTTVTVAEDAELNTDELANELQLNGGTSMSLDEDTVAALDKDKTITVSITPLDENDELMGKLTKDQKEQIGDNTVYDFNMAYTDGDKITDFGGSVTISLPYTLAEDEDVDSIDVWYIDDDGNATRVTGTYSNGFVTFTTTHFSYYTVTRLTPAERCNRYGHIMVTAQKAATCTQDGFDMSVCQRCGYVEKDEVITRLGHDYDEVTVVATCTQAGSYEKTCKNSGCSHKVTGVLPKLSHDMQKDETLTVAPSCSAAGKEVYVCSREGCDQTREDAIAQLSHNYETVTVKAADCSNKGYTEKKCSLCDDVIYTDETLPLGHTYTVSGWSWSHDHLSAELQLVCVNDKTHVKTLTAVVTQQKDNATCSGSGTVVYTATASFNQVSYTDTYTETSPAVGHKPGGQWVSDADGHYHICTVCSEHVDVTGHTWNDGTVTKEPTCGDAGTAAYQCTVCQYEKEKILPATKEHNYVDGVCSACGKEETGCIHQRLTAAEVDLTGWNICEGAEIVKYTCDCGENAYYDWDLSCKFSEDSYKEEIIDYEGQQVVRISASCGECGLEISLVQAYRMKENSCAGYETYCYTITAPGQEPLVGTQVSDYERLHPLTVAVQTVSLEEYGLCSEKLTYMTCSCGKANSVRYNETCEWRYTGNDETYACARCGATKQEAYGDGEKGDCFAEELVTVIYCVDGERVYTTTSNYIYANHTYEVTDFELFGQSCEDGIWLEYTCSECGGSRQLYREYHAKVIEEVVDLSDFEICSNSVVLASCPCEEHQQSFYFDGDTECVWYYTGFNEATGEEIFSCGNCGAQKIWTQTDGQKDENCVYVYDEISSFFQADGTPIFTGRQTYTSRNHDYETQYTLLGDDCEDGVQISQVCRDCGEKDEYEVNYHQTFKQESYDLAEYGLCDGELSLYGCACGNSIHSYWDDECKWEQIGGMGDEDSYQGTFYCSQCNSYYDDISEWKKIPDACKTESKLTYRFYKDSDAPEYVLTISFTRCYEAHDCLATLVLNDSELGCAGGYTVYENCQNCDYTDTWIRSGDDYHEVYLVDKEVYSSDKLCGDIIVQTYSCACGSHGNTEINLWSNGCSWSYYEAKDGSYYMCETCGTQCKVAESAAKVEGETCIWQNNRNMTFINGTDELFSISLVNKYYDHRYVFTFEMEGQNCSDGYYVNGSCLDCGQTESFWDNYCCSVVVAREVLANDPDACGPVDMVYYSCPCGNVSDWSIDSRCNWSWYGYDEENGCEIMQCTDCGMQWIEQYDSQRIPGTCQYEVTRTGEFTLGENTYGYEKSIIERQHTTVYRYNLLGETCEDGVEVTRACAYCDYTSSTWTECSHTIRTVAYYNLADYGMCGGCISHRACGCGLESSWGWSLTACELMSTGTIDEDTNDTVWICRECGTYICWGEDGELNTDTCTFEGTFYCKIWKADEVILNLRGATSREEHTTHALYQQLVNPDGDCEDGVIRYWQCQYCGEGWENTSYSHSRIETACVEAPCGGKIRYMSCACGENVDVYLENDCASMSYEHYEQTDDNGVLHQFTNRTCTTCGLSVVSEWYNIPQENCITEYTEICTITINGEVTVYSFTERSTEHRNLTASSTLAPGAENCNEGTVITEYCASCGYSSSWYSSGHSTYVTEEVDLADIGGCGGRLEIWTCACGQEQGMQIWNSYCNRTYDSWETTGENGVVYEHYLRTCEECGLKEQTVRHKEATDTLCSYNFHEVTTVTLGDNQWSIQSSYTEMSHQWKTTYSLLEGSVTCNDGIMCTEVCEICQLSNSWTSSYHGANLVESVDLSEYSSVCGGYLNFYQCPCGVVTSYDFDGDNCCDFDATNIDVWIEDAVNEFNPCIDGTWQTHWAYEYRCAVNEPEICGLVIRQAHYCLKTDGCHLTEYVTWQIGYDEETDTCLREITFETGKKQFHNYEITGIHTDVGEDGTYTDGQRYVCQDCGSEYHYFSLIDADGNVVRSETAYINTLNDGQDQYTCWVDIFEIINDIRYKTSERYDCTHADGSQYWYQHVYEYYPEECTRKDIYTNSYGDTSEDVYEWHQSYTRYYESEYATCSQPGWYHEWDVCDVCGKTSWEISGTYIPGHRWYWDDELQTYSCGDCGLYNTSGADGDIILEDLTEEYSDGTKYVVGYYNPDEHMFVANVSVVLDNAEVDDNIIDLGITDFTYYDYDEDGFTGLSVDKETVDAAAAEAVAALEDYEGTYAIRISFVPVSSHFTLDYGITFDSVTAE